MNTTQDQSIGRFEFVMLMAAMFATTAFSIDAMLPGMREIASEITPDAPARAAWVLTAFVGGLGFGTFFAGPLSDAYGRKTAIYAGTFIYILAAAFAWLTHSLEWMLVARFVQGIGAAGPRIVSLAIIRDLYQGREMARIVSFATTLFILVPAIAPAMGAGIIALAGWRSIFGAFILFSVITVFWLGVRLKEPLPRAARRPIRLNLLFSAIGEMARHAGVRRAIIVQTLVMAMLFATLTMIQPIYDVAYGAADTFHWYFGGIALLSASASLLNARIVVRVGMQAVVTWTLGCQVVLSSILLALLWNDSSSHFYIFLVWQLFLFCQAGLTVGNLNAIAMEPMGHIAGMAASVVGSVSTVVAAMIASPIGLLFDGTPRPLMGSIIVLGIAAIFIMRGINAATKA
ncbi:MFS transporter [Ascidiaceihabitans sp.]|uniref:MFS transporter n=1 Tax=Ascidiaceihabitans sp. TaxID=1872644 RepID=UPI003299411B